MNNSKYEDKRTIIQGIAVWVVLITGLWLIVLGIPVGIYSLFK